MRDELWWMRKRLSESAAEEGCRLAASGVSPYASPGLPFVTDRWRYHELARRYPDAIAGFGTCACHVHVSVRSRDVGVRVLARIRPWLATLLATLPISAGRPTGWNSHRFRMVSQWTTAWPPGVWRDSRHYD